MQDFPVTVASQIQNRSARGIFKLLIALTVNTV